jgi:glucose/arabinose dehydrogenase
VSHLWSGAATAGLCLIGQALTASSADALDLHKVARLAQPVYVTAPPGDSRELFVLERAGRVRIVRNGHVRKRPFLDIRGRVDLPFPEDQFGDQGGLVSMAFAPDYRLSGRFYLFYTHVDGTIHVDEFLRAPGSPSRASPSSARTVLSVARDGARTDLGGQIEFGPDGFLYVGFGYGSDPGSSQDLGLLTGKILRIDPRPADGQPYSVPSDNPFLAQPGARPEILAYGLRMPWRFSFDPETRNLLVADVGGDLFEEVNVLRPEDAGANLGWPLYEGHHEHSPGGGGTFTFPVLIRAHVAGFCAIVGGYRIAARGPPSLRNRYIYGDVCTGRLRSARLGLPTATGDRSERLLVRYLVSFGRDARGGLYAVSLDGPIYRISR